MKQIHELQAHIVKLETELQKFCQAVRTKNLIHNPSVLQPTEVSTDPPQAVCGEPLDRGEERTGSEDELEESAESAREEQEGESLESWHKVEMIGSRYKCPVCGYSRNTKHQIVKHIKEQHEQEIDDGTFLCSECSYQSISRNHLENHISRAHNHTIKNKN